ncbi:MAG: sodium:solute symporter family protein [Clostridiales Family XIII bacterium]|jgi:SSS family solute:Na+ symporter|nr:sodium:solute symporter family protein [Clostridiales Family XIII bacterium]
MNTFDISIIVIYFVAMVAIGVYAGKRQQGMDDYFLGGRNMGAVTLATLWMAGWIGGTSVVGTASNGYSMGITAVWYVFSIAVGLVVFGTVMTKPVKLISDKLNNITIPDFMESRYDTKVRIVTSFCIICAMIGFTASQFTAGASILNVLTGWDPGKCYLMAGVVITVYVAAGGLLAVTYTDWIQMILLLAGVTVIGIPLTAAALNDTGSSLATALPPEYFDIGRRGWGEILTLTVSSGISFFTMMDSYTRIVSAKSAKAARNGTFLAAIAVVIIALSCTYIGMAAKAILPSSEMAANNNALAAMVVEVFPHGVKALVLVGVLCAIMSTADISIVIASTSGTKDIYMRFINPEAKEKNVVLLGLAISLVVGLLGGLLGWYINDVISILMLTFTIQSAGLFLPIICAFFWKRASANAAFVSMVSAATIIIFWFIGGMVSDAAIFDVRALWPAMGVSGILFVILSVSHKKTAEEEEKAELFYAATKRQEVR